jgi:hypothetical protein
MEISPYMWQSMLAVCAPIYEPCLGWTLNTFDENHHGWVVTKFQLANKPASQEGDITQMEKSNYSDNWQIQEI